MAQIHHVKVDRRNEVQGASDLNRLVHNGETYEVKPDGCFHVPDDLATFLLSRPGWFEGANPFAKEQPEPVEREAPRKPSLVNY